MMVGLLLMKSRRMKFVVLGRLLLAAQLFVAVAAHAQSYCVRAGATGSGNGSSWDNAYPSLPSTLVRGATYYVADGTYSGYTFSTAVSGTSVVTVKKATVAEHGPSTGWQDSYGDGVAQFNGQINVTKSYFVFDGVTGGGPGNWTNGLGFKVVVTSASPTIAINMSQFSASASDITFAHIETVGNDGSNQGGGGIANDAYAFFGQVSAIKVSYCYSHDMGRCHIFSSGQNVTIEYSCFGDYTSSAATHAEAMSIDPQLGSSVRNWTVRYCLFTHVEGTGGVMFNGQGMNFYGNVFYRPTGDTWESGNGLVGGWTGASGEVMKDYLVYNNSFINVNTTVLTTLPQTYSGCAAWNNIFYNCSTPSFAKFTSHNYNHFINSGGTSGEANGTSATSGDPFVDYVNLDFRLKAATAAGSNLGAPFNVDPFGRTRGSDGVWDRGAYEFGSGSSTNPSAMVTPSTLNFGPVDVGTTSDLPLTIQNVGGGTLSGSASVGTPFQIVSGATYSLGSNQLQTITVRYAPTTAGAHSGTITLTGGTTTTVSVSGQGVTPPPPATASFEAESGNISSPFTVSSGAISQSTTTDLAGGGRAVYTFSVPSNGVYTVTALVNAPSLTQNTFYVNVDAEPTDPFMIWDIPVTSGFETRTLSWRGYGASDSYLINPKSFLLSTGSHSLILIGREANCALDRIQIVSVPTLPQPPSGLTVLGGQ